MKLSQEDYEAEIRHCCTNLHGIINLQKTNYAPLTTQALRLKLQNLRPYHNNPFEVLCIDEDKLEDEALSKEPGALEVYAGNFDDVINSPIATPDETVSAMSPIRP